MPLESAQSTCSVPMHTSRKFCVGKNIYTDIWKNLTVTKTSLIRGNSRGIRFDTEQPPPPKPLYAAVKWCQPPLFPQRSPGKRSKIAPTAVAPTSNVESPKPVNGRILRAPACLQPLHPGRNSGKTLALRQAGGLGSS